MLKVKANAETDVKKMPMMNPTKCAFAWATTKIESFTIQSTAGARKELTALRKTAT